MGQLVFAYPFTCAFISYQNLTLQELSLNCLVELDQIVPGLTTVLKISCRSFLCISAPTSSAQGSSAWPGFPGINLRNAPLQQDFSFWIEVLGHQ